MRTKRGEAQVRLVPTLRYRDTTAAIEWLCAAFGFQRHHILTAADGSFCYAQLTFGDDLVVLSPARSSAAEDGPEQPGRAISAAMQSCYLVVDDVDRHYRRAKEQGADIVDDIGDYDFVGRGYSCRDLEGHVWNFGTRDPRQWEPDGAARRPSRVATLRHRLGARVSIVAIAATAAAWMFVAFPQPPTSGIEKSIGVIGSQPADDGIAHVIPMIHGPIDLREHATTIASQRADADVGRTNPDAAVDPSPMKGPTSSVIAHTETAKEDSGRPAAAVQQQLIRPGTLNPNIVPSASEPSAGQSRRRKAVAQFWRCLPREPTGDVVCRPITGRDKQ
jgi:uncharacterized glyoxalase superfamily protein PhnB